MLGLTGGLLTFREQGMVMWAGGSAWPELVCMAWQGTAPPRALPGDWRTWERFGNMMQESMKSMHFSVMM